MTQLSCKHDTKSKSHPGMKLAPVRVFSCKHPLTSLFTVLLASGNSCLGEAELVQQNQMAQANDLLNQKEPMKLTKGDAKKKSRRESSLFIFDELNCQGQLTRAKCSLGKKSILMYFVEKCLSALVPFPYYITVVNQSKWPIKYQSLFSTDQSLVNVI